MELNVDLEGDDAVTVIERIFIKDLRVLSGDALLVVVEVFGIFSYVCGNDTTPSPRIITS